MSVVSSIRSAAAQAVRGAQPTAAKQPAGSEFARVLKDHLGAHKISLSAHAADRIVRRGVTVGDSTADQLNAAFDLASKKGSREALFLLDDMAVIASIPDRTVKTAMDRNAMGAGVFTQIDTAIVMTSNNSTEEINNQSQNQSPGSSGWAPTRDAAIQPGGLRP